MGNLLEAATPDAAAGAFCNYQTRYQCPIQACGTQAIQCSGALNRTTMRHLPKTATYSPHTPVSQEPHVQHRQQHSPARPPPAALPAQARCTHSNAEVLLLHHPEGP